jgi:hypothetical protein
MIVGDHDAKVFKKYSKMKLQMKREALAKLNRLANEAGSGIGTAQRHSGPGFGTVLEKEGKGSAKRNGRRIE